MKYNENISHHNKNENVVRNTETIHHSNQNKTISKNSIKFQTHSKRGKETLIPSHKSMNNSTAHFYVIIYTILFWDCIACINLIFFPFLYYSSPDFGISNKKFMIYIIKVNYFLDEVCAINLNWNTAILSINRFIAIYFPYRFANLTNRNHMKNEGENVPPQKYSMKNNAYLNYIRQLFGHDILLKKTRKSGMILMTSIFLFSIILSAPYLFYVELKEGVRDIHSKQNTTVVLYQVLCHSKLLKNPIKFSYYYVMSKFFHSFSIRYDNFFSILVYFLPTLLIMFSQIFVFAKLKKLKKTVNVKLHFESNISKNTENSLTMAKQNSIPSQLSPKNQISKHLTNSLNPRIIPVLITPPIRSHLPKNDQNNKTIKFSKFNLDKYILTLAIGIEFLLLNLPYVIFVFITNQSWVDGASSKITTVQAIVYFLKYSNHSLDVYINIVFNSIIRNFLRYKLNKCYRSYIARTHLTSTNTN
ncbi:unnamed protein product [Gordionus sp. m RMFG-2023]